MSTALDELMYGFGTDTSAPDYASEALTSSDTPPVATGSQLPAGGMNDWGSWAMGIANQAIGASIDTYKYRTIAGAGGIPAVGQNGKVYTEGTRTPAPAQTVAGVPVVGLVVLGVVALAAVLLLRK